MVVLATLPLLGAMLTEGLKALPLVLLTSKPVGAVTVISAVNALPLTVKLCCAEAVPLQAVKAVVVPVVVMEGVGAPPLYNKIVPPIPTDQPWVAEMK